MTGVPYVFIGDDFTGASDTLATLADRNWRARLFLEAPSRQAISGENLDAVGIATDLRALPPDVISDQLDGLLPAVAALAPSVVHYKICSTFDSAPHTGNIATAVALLERHLAPELTLIIGGQPSLGRFCAFGNLFARAADGHTHRIDRHPVMMHHPITPMAEADLRRHLETQGLTGLDLVPLQTVSQGPDAVAAALETVLLSDRRRVLFDATEDRHLEHIGTALRHCGGSGKPLLAVGASSVAETFARPKTLAATGPVEPQPTTPAACLTLVIAGSRSSVTAAQIEAAGSFRKRPVSLRDLTSEAGFSVLLADCAAMLNAGHNALVHLMPDEDYAMSGTQLSLHLADLARRLLKDAPVRNIGIAGGDTSSIIARKLGFDSLSFESRAGRGTAVCRTCAKDAALNGLRLLFKGGQVGPETVFDDFAHSGQA